MFQQGTSTRGSKIRGATRQSWRASSPRELLEKLVDGNVGKSYEELLRLFGEKAKESDEFISTIIEYWFANNYRALMTIRDSDTLRAAREERAKAVRQKAAEIGEAVSSTIRTKAKLMLLDLMMPNGKRLRACTGEECRKLSKSTGRWLVAVSREVPAGQKVGEFFTEDRLAELYEAASA